jgi:ABC-type transporter Mla maintaining outer membrane lipid asymmetry ATPase subunit MlaF
MIGLLKPASGTVWMEGVNVTGAGEEQMRRIRSGMGVLFQSEPFSVP